MTSTGPVQASRGSTTLNAPYLCLSSLGPHLEGPASRAAPATRTQ